MTNSAKIILTALIGAAAGGLAQLLNVPLAWLLGPLVAVAVSAFAGLPVAMPAPLRDWMLAVFGVLIGGAFVPGVFAHGEQWILTLGTMVVCTLITTAAGGLLLHRVFRQDRITAFISGVPGSLSQMIALSGEAGADIRAVSLAHIIRMALIVMIAPSVLLLTYSGAPPAGGAVERASSPMDLAILAACVFAFPAARAMRLPSATILGPLTASAILHNLGLVHANPPFFVVAVAQIVVGSYVGARFAGVTGAMLAAYMRAALSLTALVVAISLVFAFALSRLTGFGLPLLVLAFVPGGAPEMSVVALSLDMDPAFVTTHHLLRVIVLLVLAPLAMRRLRREPEPDACRNG